MMKEALEMEKQSLTSEREAFQRVCAQLEKEDIEKERKAFEKEMAMAREAYIKGKSDIQRMRVTFQSEKLNMEKERETLKKVLREQRIKKEAFHTENGL
ncbi:Highly reducing polyketide synthase easB [Dissostichus eleginoides]|uniref:Highly reducing polyketide synthase easB n=1 Tax=Dissostichus eleginoides TaxID=100907 RepID=A0AAD9C2Y9_DISEL|nr:Highly reducing polyketide synthase easB [Dissostichus eleginoides]